MDAKARVLVVEDSAEVAQMLTEVLTEDGYAVELALDGAGAIDAVKQRRPDLILLDLMMPGYSGWDFLTMYRLTTPPYAPILVITAAPETTLLGVDSSLGVQEVVRKPYSVDHVLALVRAHTAHRPPR